MNIKSLLLGSAAALVAVTGARAADPIVAEPETAQYVRVCDVYGTGFFYIPGTETCLKIGGYVRLRYGAVNRQTNLDGDDYIAGSRVRARVNFDAREETEVGQLRAFIQLQGENTFGGSISGRNNTVVTFPGQVPTAGSAFFSQLPASGEASVIVDNAYIQLGGLTMGYLDSLWAEGDGLLTDTDWSVGDYKFNRISYTYADNNFSAAVSLEDDGDGDFAPNVVAKVAYDSDVFGAYLAGAYESRADAFDFDVVNQRFDVITGLPLVAPATLTTFSDPFAAADADSAFAVKAGASVKNFLAEGSELKVEGHYAFDPTLYAQNDIVTRFSGQTRLFNSVGIPIEQQIGLGYSQPIGPFGVAVSGAVGKTFDLFTADAAAVTVDNPNGFVNLGSTDYYVLGLNVGYEVTKNFTILGEVTYRDLDLPAQFDDFDQTAGFIEFKRSF